MARENLGDDTLEEGFFVGQVQAVVEKMRGMGHVPGEDGTVPVQIMLDGQTLKGSITRTKKGRIFGAQDLTFFSGLDDGNLRVRDAEAFLKCAIEVSATPEGCTTAAVRTIVAFLRRQQPRLEERKEEADKKREKTERKYEKKVHKADNVANGEEAREEESESDDSDDEIEALEARAARRGGDKGEEEAEGEEEEEGDDDGDEAVVVLPDAPWASSLLWKAGAAMARRLAASRAQDEAIVAARHVVREGDCILKNLS